MDVGELKVGGAASVGDDGVAYGAEVIERPERAAIAFPMAVPVAYAFAISVTDGPAARGGGSWKYCDWALATALALFTPSQVKAN